MERVLGFVDGFNLYFGLRAAGYKPLLWLDISKLVSNLCKPHQTCMGVNYFTARINGPGPKHDRQKTLLEAYETPKRVSHRLCTLASAYFHISRRQLANSQLAETITKPDGFVLRRPPSWT